MAKAVEVSHIRKDFILPMSRKRVRAIDDLSFSVEEGGIVGFLGANGAGKTSTIKAILRLIFQDSGTIKIFGQNNDDVSIKEKIGFLTERPYFYDYLSAREFLKFVAHLFRDREAPKRIDGLLEEVGLTHAADRPLRRFSKGMLQRVGIAQALINNPKLLILDEPMSGLDPDGRAEMVKIIERANKRGATVMFSTHLLHDVEVICDRVVMIDKGKLVVESAVTTLLDSHSKGFGLDLRTAASQFQNTVHAVYQTDQGLQHAIQNALKNGDKVYRVLPSRPSLEEVFVKLKRGAV